MADRGPDVRRLLSQLGLSADPRHATKAQIQPAPARDASSDTLAAFFDSVRRAPPRTVAEVPPTIDHRSLQEPMEQTVLLSAQQRSELPMPGVRVLSEDQLSPPTLRFDPPPLAKVQVLSPAPAAEAPQAVAPPVVEAAAAPLSEVFRRLVDAGLRRR